MSLKTLTSKFIDIKTIVSIILTLVATFGWVSTKTDEFATSVSNKIYANVTIDTYAVVKYDLMKQLEKLDHDPEDIKQNDIYKFAYFCEGYFKEYYIPTQSNARALNIGCDKVLELYDKSYTKTFSS